MRVVACAQRRKSDQQTAMSYAAYRCVAYLLPAARPALDSFMAVLGYDPAAVNGTSNPAKTAAATTNAIIAVRSNDGSNQANNYADTTGYVPVNTPMQARQALRGHACGAASARALAQRQHMYICRHALCTVPAQKSHVAADPAETGPSYRGHKRVQVSLPHVPASADCTRCQHSACARDHKLFRLCM